MEILISLLPVKGYRLLSRSDLFRTAPAAPRVYIFAGLVVFAGLDPPPKGTLYE